MVLILQRIAREDSPENMIGRLIGWDAGLGSFDSTTRYDGV